MIEQNAAILGYAEFVAAIQDRAHPDHEEILEQIGGDFGLDEVNQQLTAIK